MKERNTKQKSRILETVCASHEHPTAEQVYNMISDEFDGLSLGTVYRNLSRMADSGMIRRISVNNSPDRFDGDMSPHYHVCCSRCGRFDDYFDVDGDLAIRGRIERDCGFSITRQETVFYGLCPQCDNQKN